MTDKAFREKLLTKPNLAIEEVSGKALPPGTVIRVVESDPAAHLTFLLPRMVSDELSAGDLENVAGGVCDGDCGFDICPTGAVNRNAK